MGVFRRTIPQRILSLVLMLILLLGSTSVNAASTTSIPPTATAINLNTYGALPVIILNLTQSKINMTFEVSDSNNSSNGTNYITSSGPGVPIAIGLSGVYYLNNHGYTSTAINNMYNPGSAANSSSSASLMPFTNLMTDANPQWDFMNMFTLFPSWTQKATFNNVQYVGLTNLDNQGSAAYNYNVVSGYPNGNGDNITKSGDYTSAKGLNAADASQCSINLTLLDGNGQAAEYAVLINSLGAGTSDNYKHATLTSIFSVLNSILTVVGDVMVWVNPDDVFYKTSMVVGAISSLLSMQGQLQNETPNAYTATTKGINVSAEAGFYLNGNNISINETFTLYQGDSDALTYKLAPNGTTNAAPTEAQDNVLFITTWRQKPQTNTSTQEPSSADLLIVALINQSLYSSQQLTKHLTQTTTPSQQKLTREQARDTSKVLSVLSTIRKAHPQDAQYIVGMFGIHGKYEEIKKNPNELRTLNQRLKQILSPYRNNSLVIEQSLPKL